ncbi:MAG: hypothetical protein IPG97_16190 [Microthrixaceae bacterium]|nr:hypothetical protein [Microthrixaceae bacterium]
MRESLAGHGGLGPGDLGEVVHELVGGDVFAVLVEAVGDVFGDGLGGPADEGRLGKPVADDGGDAWELLTVEPVAVVAAVLSALEDG